MSASLTLPREVPIAKRRAPVVSREVKERAKKSLAHWVGVAREKFNRPVAMPTISFDLVGTTAGKAFQAQRHIQLNAVLLTENLAAFESDTIPHELAHVLVMDFTGSRGGHGPEWQSTMRRLGVMPERTHTFDVTNSRTTEVVQGYACGCGPHPMTTRKHNSARRGTRYICKKCRKRIQWVGTSEMPGAPRSVMVPPAGGGAVRPGTFPRPVLQNLPVASKRPPSEAMLRFAASLAKKHSMVPPASVLADFELCRQFLDKWAKAAVGNTPTSVQPRTQPPARPPAPAVSLTLDGPTEKQLAYAKSIAARKNLHIPAVALTSKREISLWIDQNR